MLLAEWSSHLCATVRKEDVASYAGNAREVNAASKTGI